MTEKTGRKWPWWSKLLVFCVVAILATVVGWKVFESTLRSECRAVAEAALAAAGPPRATGDGAQLDRWLALMGPLEALGDAIGVPIVSSSYEDELPPDGSPPPAETVTNTTRLLESQVELLQTVNELIDGLPLIYPTTNDADDLEFRFVDVRGSVLSFLHLQLFRARWTGDRDAVNDITRRLIQLRLLRPDRESWFEAMTAFGTDFDITESLQVALPELEAETIDLVMQALSEVPVSLPDAWRGERVSAARNLLDCLEHIPSEDLIFLEISGPLGEIRYFRAHLQMLRFIEAMLPRLDTWTEIDLQALRTEFQPATLSRWLDLEYPMGMGPVEVGISLLESAQRHRRKVLTTLVALELRRERLRRGSLPSGLEELTLKLPPWLHSPGDDLGLTLWPVRGGMVVSSTSDRPPEDWGLLECYEEPGWFPVPE